MNKLHTLDIRPVGELLTGRRQVGPSGPGFTTDYGSAIVQCQPREQSRIVASKLNQTEAASAYEDELKRLSPDLRNFITELHKTFPYETVAKPISDYMLALGTFITKSQSSTYLASDTNNASTGFLPVTNDFTAPAIEYDPHSDSQSGGTQLEALNPLEKYIPLLEQSRAALINTIGQRRVDQLDKLIAYDHENLAITDFSEYISEPIFDIYGFYNAAEIDAIGSKVYNKPK